LFLDYFSNIPWNHMHKEILLPSVQIVNCFDNLYGGAQCLALPYFAFSNNL
jgi:hypothetical protein